MTYDSRKAHVEGRRAAGLAHPDEELERLTAPTPPPVPTPTPAPAPVAIPVPAKAPDVKPDPKAQAAAKK